jgi:hypothetical protein
MENIYMSKIRDIVDVQITRASRSITRQGFGTLLVIADVVDGVASKGFRVKTYSDMTAVAVDWTDTDYAYKAAQAYFGQTPSPRFLKIGIYDSGTAEADTSYSDALTKIAELDSDWYGVVAETRVPAEVENLADTVNTYERLYGTATNDSAILDDQDNTDIASVLNLATHERTFVLYSTDASEAPEAAWFGKMLPTDPGSATWSFKALAGISADQLSSAQAESAFGKKANTYEQIAGANITRYGTVASGEYIDVIRGLDWLRARMSEQLYFRLVNSPKIAYTEAGFAIIESDMKAVLNLAFARGVITDDFSIEFPNINDILEIDKADRLLQDVKFYATLQGAVHKIKIRGIVSV